MGEIADGDPDDRSSSRSRHRRSSRDQFDLDMMGPPAVGLLCGLSRLSQVSCHQGFVFHMTHCWDQRPRQLVRAET